MNILIPVSYTHLDVYKRQDVEITNKAMGVNENEEEQSESEEDEAPARMTHELSLIHI